MMTVELRPWPELQDLIPPLSSAELEGLRRSIEADGVQVPILALPDGRIIDGHHRWMIANGDAPVEIRDIDEGRALLLGIALNRDRRHLSPEQKREMARKLRARGLSQTETAEVVGVERSTVSKWESASDVNIHNTCSPDLRLSIPRSEYETIAGRCEAGETQAEVAADYKITRQRVGQIIQLVEARNSVPGSALDTPLPERRYRCIVIDPPWPMKKVEREVRQKQGQTLDYPTMALDEIEALPIGDLALSDGCHVYLWVTQKYLPEGLRLFGTWGVKYQCVMTWVKPVGFTPFSWMYNTEHVLFGRIGSLNLERVGLKLSFEAPVTRHSEKPPVFYERVVEASPAPRLEMFARQARGGFDVWGNEVEGLATRQVLG